MRKALSSNEHNSLMHLLHFLFRQNKRGEQCSIYGTYIVFLEGTGYFIKRVTGSAAFHSDLFAHQIRKKNKKRGNRRITRNTNKRKVYPPLYSEIWAKGGGGL